MSKMKDLIIEITELYEGGMQVRRIAEITGLGVDEVSKIIELYGVNDPELVIDNDYS